MKKNISFFATLMAILILSAGLFCVGCTGSSGGSDVTQPETIYKNVKRFVITGLNENPGVKFTIGYDTAGNFKSEKYKRYTQNSDDSFLTGIDVYYTTIDPYTNPPMYRINTTFEGGELTTKISKIGAITSGRINSKGKINFQYGKIEASIKMDRTANGLWPAFWLLGANIDTDGWPKCGEIDIMEMGHKEGITTGTQNKYFSGAAHWGETVETRGDYNAHSNNINLQDGNFHKYTLEWTATDLKMYLDGNSDAPYFTMEITEGIAGYFNHDFYIVLNLAAGGTLPDVFTENGVTALNYENDYSASMYVDYVRVYNGSNELKAGLSDEFDDEELDTNKWNVEENSNGGGNDELQTYSIENVTLGKDQDSNYLVITAKK